MFTRFTLMILLVLLAGFAQAQYDELDHTQRMINIGIDGINSDTSISGSAIIPVDTSNVDGWVGLFGQQQTDEGEVTSQTLNAHGVFGYALSDRYGVNAFVDWTKDKERGIAGQTQFGGFVSVDLYEDDAFEVTGGVGNFLENKQAQADLEIKDTDPTVVRGLFYVLTKVGRYKFMFKGMPQLNEFSDARFTLEPSGVYELSDTLQLVLRAKLGYETEPIIEGEEFFSSYQAQIGIQF